MDEQTGTFVVAHVDEGAAELRDVETGQVFALASNPGLEADEVVEATIEPAGEMGVAYRVTDVRERRTVSITRSGEPPTRQAERAATRQDPGDLSRIERAGTGELHVITVEVGASEAAVEDVLGDEISVRARAARLGVDRVEIRAADAMTAEDAPAVGVVSVRYLP